MEFIELNDGIAVIYEIYLRDDPKINYIGSTIGAHDRKTVQAVFRSRMRKHQKSYNDWKKRLRYNSKNLLFNAYEKYGFENFTHYILASYTIFHQNIDKQFIRSQEEYYRQKLHPSLNTISAFGIDEDRQKKSSKI